MTLPELEELFFRYQETIEAICPRQRHIGDEMDGGYHVCETRIPDKSCLAYSFGNRKDYTFDDGLAAYYKCQVHSFDPDDTQVDHQRSDLAYFHKLGIGGKDEIIENRLNIKTFDSIRKLLHHEHAIGGGVQTSGLYYEHFQSAFEVSGVATSWLCSMSFVGWFLGTAIGGHIIKRFGYRICSFCGALISSFGFALCLVADNFYTLFLFYGIFGCIGNGIQICGFYTAVNCYFDKYINSAQNLASVGVGIGVSIYSVIYTGFIEEYGWRGALLLQSGVSLNSCVLACLLFPTRNNTSVRKTVRPSVILNLQVFLLCLHFYFAVITESAVYVHLPVLIISKGFTLENASLCLLIFGISTIVSRAVYSVPCNVNLTLLYTLTLCIGGILLLVLPSLQSLTTILICLSAIGFTFTVFGGINLLVIRESANLDEFVDVAAMAFLFKSVGAVSAGPLSGLVYDITQDYKFEFYLAGTVAILACIFLVPSIIKRKWRHHFTENSDCEIAFKANGNKFKSNEQERLKPFPDVKV